MKETVLLTGAKGFVGSNVWEYLSEKSDYNLVCPDGHITEDMGGKFDYIVNFASNSSVEQSIQDPQAVIDNNVSLMTSLLEIARLNPPKLFVQFSTVETQEITNPYAASKKAQEDIALAYSRTYGLPVVVIHSTNLIGKGQGQDKFIPKVIKQIKAGEPVTIYTVNGEFGKRKYNNVKNVGAAILYLLQNHEYYQSYHELGVYGGNEVNNLQMAQAIAKLLGKKLSCEFIEADTIRPNYLMSYNSDQDNVPTTLVAATLEDGLRELL